MAEQAHRRALRGGEFAQVAAEHARLTALANQLRERELPAFVAAAEALLTRAAPLAEEARIQARLAALELEVTGVVVPGDGQAPRAIVNGAIVEAGSRYVLDPQGAVIPGLEVVRIAPATVVFRLDGVEVVRPLRR